MYRGSSQGIQEVNSEHLAEEGQYPGAVSFLYIANPARTGGGEQGAWVLREDFEVKGERELTAPPWPPAPWPSSSPASPPAGPLLPSPWPGRGSTPGQHLVQCLV